MFFLTRAIHAFKAVSQLGVQQVGLYAFYKFGLLTGQYRRLTDPGPRSADLASAACRPLFALPAKEALLALLGPEGLKRLLAEADEIAARKVRLFGADPVPLRLTFREPLSHWTAYETRPQLLTSLYSQIPDVKFLWEPARFGWAFVLGRAYYLSGDERYARTFWRLTETFLDANPPCLGPHWMSGQEVALRLLAFTWAGQVFAASPESTADRAGLLADAVAAHAARIPPTLVYARSQHNNHLISEAAGLFTAGLALPDHPDAPTWRSLGWKWLNAALLDQIDGYGEYAQHSANYHRLMLSLALWVDGLLRMEGRAWPPPTLEALGRATHWLLALLDPATGRTPVLGANDGALLFPLSTCAFADFRPTAHAAARAFLNYHLPAGPWDETALWLGVPPETARTLELPRYVGDHLSAGDSWGYLRAVRLSSRPSHADQLHFDLWWRGLNVAQDAGTYVYNAPAPWDNALTSTLVHNTVSVDGREQMTRAGRFLYLDWADGYYKTLLSAEEHVLHRARARHYGYWRKGVRHTRSVTAHDDECWLVVDTLDFLPWLFWARRRRTFRLHWLLPDWKWKVDSVGERVALSLQSPQGPVVLTVSVTTPGARIRLARAGETVYGPGAAAPIDGWASPTYGVKVPALSMSVSAQASGEVKFTSEFRFPK